MNTNVCVGELNLWGESVKQITCGRNLLPCLPFSHNFLCNDHAKSIHVSFDKEFSPLQNDSKLIKNRIKLTYEILHVMLGVYGDVMRVKILFNKKDSALVQMREPTQAQIGTKILHSTNRKRFFRFADSENIYLSSSNDISGSPEIVRETDAGDTFQTHVGPIAPEFK